MKTTLFLSIICCVCVSPALGELTPSDLDKIRLIVKEEIKAEVNTAKEELRAEIKVLKQDTEKQITKLEADLKTYIDTKVESLDERLSLIVVFISGMMILVVVTVSVPQVIMAWREWERKEQTLAKKIEAMAEEIEKVKQQYTVNS